MKQYKIFEHTNGKIEAVKQGWSWPAFFFSLLWAVVKKMYLTGIALFLFSLLLDFLVIQLELGVRGDAMINILSIAISVIFGLKGNEWREAMLVNRHFEEKTMIEAATPQAAMTLYRQRAA